VLNQHHCDKIKDYPHVDQHFYIQYIKTCLWLFGFFVTRIKNCLFYHAFTQCIVNACDDNCNVIALL